MRRALQKASTFHSSIDPPDGVTTANEILSPQQPLQPYAQTQQQDEVQSQSDPGGPASLSPKPLHNIKHNIKTQRRASTANNHSDRKTCFSSTASAPQLPSNDLLNRVKTQIHLSEILLKISTLWAKPLPETPVTGDFHRLAHRITIRDCRNGKLEEYSMKEGNPKELVSYLLIHLTQILEEESQAENIASVIESLKQSDCEMRYWMESVLTAAGEKSKLVGLCKTVSQNIISPVATQIKIILAVTNGLIKDASSSSDGWKILLQFFDDCVICSHIRKEISVNSGANSFEFEWKLDLKFSLDMENMMKVELELKGLRCNEEMPVEQKQKLVDLLAQMVVVE